MQFKTKLGLVDVPNAQVIAAASSILGVEVERVAEENRFLHDALDAFEWQRINAMSHAEVHKELLADGYTEERLNAGMAKVRAMCEAAMARKAKS